MEKVRKSCHHEGNTRVQILLKLYYRNEKQHPVSRNPQTISLIYQIACPLVEETGGCDKLSKFSEEQKPDVVFVDICISLYSKIYFDAHCHSNLFKIRYFWNVKNFFKVYQYSFIMNFFIFITFNDIKLCAKARNTLK